MGIRIYTFKMRFEWSSLQNLYLHDVHIVEYSSILSKTLVCNVISAQAEISWQLKNEVMSEAGNGAGKTHRQSQC